MRGPVREEKEAYSVPVIPGLSVCPFLLSQAVSYTRNTHSLGCCILWISLPSLDWAMAAGDEEPPPKHLNRRVTSHSFPLSAYNTSSQILEVGRVRAGTFNPSSGRLVQGLWAHLYFLRDPIKQAPAVMLVHSPWTQHQAECFRRVKMHP